MLRNSLRGLDFELGEVADALRDTVSAFTAGEIAPLADQIDRSDEFPRALWPKMGALGLHGITVEEDYGGSGLGYLEHCVAMEEVSRGRARSGSPTGRIRTFASTSSAATDRRSRSASICRN